MAAAPDNTGLDELFEKLERFTKNEQHKKALKVADDILAINPADEDAKRVRIVAHMQLGEWDQALTSISKSGLASTMQFEQAYCMYRLGKIEEGLKVLAPLLSSPASAESASDVAAALELAAQLQYRLGRSKECIQLYDTLFQRHSAQVAGDLGQLRSNVLAAYVASGLSREIPSIMAAMKISARDSFEIGFNKACGLLESGDLAAAENELRLALKLGRETLFEEECSEEEVEEELAPLTVQLAHVLGRQGKQAEAQELYDKVLRGKAELSDEATRAVAVNNSFADTGRIDGQAAHRKTVGGVAKKLEGLMQDSAKPGSMTLTPGLEARLSAAQKRLLTLNRALAYLLTGRMEPARELATQLARSDAAAPGASSSTHLVPLLQAAILAKDGKAAEADAVLEQFISTQPPTSSQSVAPALARVQLALEAGDTKRAAQLAAAATAVLQASSTPTGALLATHVALLNQLNDTQGAEQVLDQALAAHKSTPSAAAGQSGSTARWCLEQLVGLKLRLGKVQEALAAYSQLQALGGARSAAGQALLARLIRCVASTALGGAAAPSSSSIAALAKDLPNLAADIRGLNVDALEGAPSTARAAAAAAAAGPSSAEDMEVDGAAAAADKAAGRVRSKKPSSKSKKRKRLPKGYNPDLPNGGLPAPDPERWLPKWQRSDAGKKKKKLKSAVREKGQVKGSQGAGKVDETLDRTKQEAQKTEPAKAAAKPTLPAKAAKKGKK